MASMVALSLESEVTIATKFNLLVPTVDAPDGYVHSRTIANLTI